MSTFIDTILSDGTIQRVISYDTTTIIYTPEEYKQLINDTQNSIDDLNSTLNAMQPISVQTAKSQTIQIAG